MTFILLASIIIYYILSNVKNYVILSIGVILSIIMIIINISVDFTNILIKIIIVALSIAGLFTLCWYLFLYIVNKNIDFLLILIPLLTGIIYFLYMFFVMNQPVNNLTINSEYIRIILIIIILFFTSLSVYYAVNVNRDLGFIDGK